MVFGEFKEILFWKDIEQLIEHERKILAEYNPNLQPENQALYARASADFIRVNIPTKEEFYKRIEEYAQNGRPGWIAGRNPCCDNLSLAGLQKAYKNQFRGAERASTLTRGVETWATHIGFYAEKVLSANQNNILELTIGAGFGTASVVEKMRDGDFYVGVDIDFKCVKNAEGILSHYGKSGTAIATSLWNLPFDDETFSVVCSHLGIDECREVPIILEEAVRVLTPGGRIVLTCSDTGYKRTRSYFEPYGIDEQEALACLRRTRHYADRAQIDEIMGSLNMTLTDCCQFDGRYVVVYTKTK